MLPDWSPSSPYWLCVHGYIQSTMFFGSLHDEAAELKVDAVGLGPLGHGYVGPASPGGGARKVEAGERYDCSLQDRSSQRLRSGQGISDDSGVWRRAADDEHGGQHSQPQFPS